MNKIALKKFVIIRYLDSCHKYPYGYGKYTESVGDFRITSLISDIIDYHHPLQRLAFTGVWGKTDIKVYRHKRQKVFGWCFYIIFTKRINWIYCLKVTYYAVSS